MTQSREYLQGFAKGLDVVSEAIRQTAYNGESVDSMQDMLNGVIEAIHHNRGVIKDGEHELKDEPEFIFGEITKEIENALSSIGYVVVTEKGGN